MTDKQLIENRQYEFDIPVSSCHTILICISTIWTVFSDRANISSYIIQRHRCTCPPLTVPSSSTLSIGTGQSHTIAYFSWRTINTLRSTCQAHLVTVRPIWTRIGIWIMRLLGAKISFWTDSSIFIGDTGVVQRCCIVKRSIVL